MRAVRGGGLCGPQGTGEITASGRSVTTQGERVSHKDSLSLPTSGVLGAEGHSRGLGRPRDGRRTRLSPGRSSSKWQPLDCAQPNSNISRFNALEPHRKPDLRVEGSLSPFCGRGGGGQEPCQASRRWAASPTSCCLPGRRPRRLPHAAAWPCGCPGRGDRAAITPPSQHPPGPFGASSHLVVCCFWWGRSRLGVVPGSGSRWPSCPRATATAPLTWGREGSARLLLALLLGLPFGSCGLRGLGGSICLQFWSSPSSRSGSRDSELRGLAGALGHLGAPGPCFRSPNPQPLRVTCPPHRSVSVSSVVSDVLALHCALLSLRSFQHPRVPTWTFLEPLLSCSPRPKLRLLRGLRLNVLGPPPVHGFLYFPRLQ